MQWKDNIKIYSMKLGCEVLDWFKFGINWRSLDNTVMKILGSIKGRVYWLAERLSVSLERFCFVGLADLTNSIELVFFINYGQMCNSILSRTYAPWVVWPYSCPSWGHSTEFCSPKQSTFWLSQRTYPFHQLLIKMLAQAHTFNYISKLN
jgi:hypothetical protein